MLNPEKMRQLLPRNFAEAKGLSKSNFYRFFIRKEFDNAVLEFDAFDNVTRIWSLFESQRLPKEKEAGLIHKSPK